MRGRLLWLVAAVALTGHAEQLPIRAYTTADGLAHNHINRIRQDSRGFLWFATDDGLTRFDGYELVNYTTRDELPHPWVNDFLETRDGEYWVASDGGVSRLLPRHKLGEAMFVTWRPGSSPDSIRVNALLEDPSGDIWCATYDGLYRLNRRGQAVQFEPVEIGLSKDYNGRLINNLALDDDGALWLAAGYGFFRRFPDGMVEWLSRERGDPG